ncbi:MAG TPA: hypothetical protein VGO64_09810 [Candidatus Limnocylindrales bacterium]|jgi:hypothetical protein|nr:hypothetical protein [Candidatus Limnocylindrales bacterium]
MTEPRRTSRTRATTVGRISDVGGDTEAGRLAELESRLARLEGAPGLRERGRGMMARVVPAEAGEHFRNAGREQLLGVRSIVDFWIRRLDEMDSRAGRVRERETIEIE